MLAKTRAVSWSPRQQEQELSFHLSAQTCREPCTPCRTACRTHSAVMPTRSWHTGRPAHSPLREEKGSNPMQSLCTAQGCSELALLDPIWDEGQSSAATTCQTPAPGCTPTRISRSDPASLSWSSIHSLRQSHTAVCGCLEGLLSPLPPPHRAVPLREPPASLSPTCGTVQRVCASGRCAPADTTSLHQLLALVHLVSLTTETSRASPTA